ncbi:aspartyl-phosphate phosphatase Spo0E family protein [Clostridium sp. MSJ-4]|uniref:Aspartyl-phosphate phosphatase Spo0E family protein n=1 Tax=Clostridium simiarum TaxID=2841506 RepID=A0ABS6EYT3_9CLOT|nr:MULTISPECIES: aspartyl-phosphate phosphatase Spo0E family protein [Clostridium]MBU5590900.1 aspartyl-phosphate phosphatase Spo0E family protein [Clostridium simiarum]
MSKEELLLEKIEEVRDLMNQLIREKQELLDQNVIQLSQRLDNLLNEYNDFLRQDD